MSMLPTMFTMVNSRGSLAITARPLILLVFEAHVDIDVFARLALVHLHQARSSPAPSSCLRTLSTSAME